MSYTPHDCPSDTGHYWRSEGGEHTHDGIVPWARTCPTVGCGFCGQDRCEWEGAPDERGPDGDYDPMDEYDREERRYAQA